MVKDRGQALLIGACHEGGDSRDLQDAISGLGWGHREHGAQTPRSDGSRDPLDCLRRDPYELVLPFLRLVVVEVEGDVGADLTEKIAVGLERSKDVGGRDGGGDVDGMG